MTENPITPKPAPSDEIDLIELIRHIWNGRWLIVKVTLAFMVLGLLIAFTTTTQYKAEARLLPEIRDTKGGASALLKQFSGLGGLSGLSLPGAEGMDAIRPDLYPNVLASTPFYIHLMQQKIKTTAGQEYTVESYMDDYINGSLASTVMDYTIKLPWTIKSWIRGPEKVDEPQMFTGITSISKEQFDIIKELRKSIHAGIDQKSGIITLSAELPDRLAAAQVAQIAVDYLTMYITTYRIAKARKDMEFTEERHAEKDAEFRQAQLSLARFRDANRNIISAAAQSEEQRLQDQYNLAFNVYNGLAQQLEQARIKVQEETPVLQVLEPVSVPVEKSKPLRALILVVFAFLGGVIGIGLIFGKLILVNIKSHLKHL
jgi:uncharacterized protein involved in exopolysaccharide biosynthesis